MFDIFSQCLHSCETQCTAKGSVIAQSGECFLSSSSTSAREQTSTSHMFNSAVRELALLSLGCPQESQTDFRSSGFFFFMSTIWSVVNTTLRDFHVLFYKINHTQSNHKCQFSNIRTTNATKRYFKSTFEIPEGTQVEFSLPDLPMN